MAVSNIRADFHAELQKVWDIVTKLEDTAWRSDLSKVEIIDGKQFVEHNLRLSDSFYCYCKGRMQKMGI